MTDLRQGVTSAQHDVLDLLYAKGPEWARMDNLQARLEAGVIASEAACRAVHLRDKRRAAIQAAARAMTSTLLNRNFSTRWSNRND